MFDWFDSSYSQPRQSERARKPGNELERPYDGAHPADGHHPERAVLPTYKEGWHIDEKKHHRWERRYWLASIILTIAVAVGAGLSAGYAYKAAQEAHDQVLASRKANELNAESGRAWIAPSELRTVQSMTVEGGVKARLFYGNPGKEPATKLRAYGFFGVLRVPQGESATDIVFPDINEQVCSYVPLKSEIVAFPTSNQNGYWIEINGKPDSIGYIMDASNTGKKLDFEWAPLKDVSEQRGDLLAIGCFRYLAAEKERISIICYFLQPTSRPVGEWEWRFCPTGQKAS